MRKIEIEEEDIVDQERNIADTAKNATIQEITLSNLIEV